MPLAHDVELRKALDEWIECWRNYKLRHPGKEVQQALKFREKQYSEIVDML